MITGSAMLVELEAVAALDSWRWRFAGAEGGDASDAPARLRLSDAMAKDAWSLEFGKSDGLRLKCWIFKKKKEQTRNAQVWMG